MRVLEIELFNRASIVPRHVCFRIRVWYLEALADK